MFVSKIENKTLELSSAFVVSEGRSFFAQQRSALNCHDVGVAIKHERLVPWIRGGSLRVAAGMYGGGQAHKAIFYTEFIVFIIIFFYFYLHIVMYFIHGIQHRGA